MHHKELENIRVLLVGDNSNGLRTLREILAKTGVETTPAFSSSSAEQTLTICFHKEGDVLLVDAAHSNASDLIQRIRITVPDIPIVAVAGEGEAGAGIAGADKVIEHSRLSPATLTSSLIAALNRNGVTRAKTKQVATGSRSERIYRQALDSLPSLIAILDGDGTISFVNKAWKHYAMRHASGIMDGDVGMNYFDICSQANDELAGHATELVEGMQAVARGEHATYYQKIMHPRTSQIRWTSTRVIRSSGGKRQLIVSHSDLTGRMRAEVAAREREAQSKMLYISNPHPMWIYDNSTLAFLSVNEAAIVKYGYSNTEFLSMTIDDIVLEPKTRTSSTPSAKADQIHRRRDGSRILAELISHNVTFEGKDATLVLAQERSRQKPAEESRNGQSSLDSEERISALLDNDFAAYFVSTPDGKLETCNSAFAAMFGFNSVAEAIAANVTNHYPSNEERRKFLALLREKKSLHRHEVMLRKKDGTPLHVLENVAGSFDANGDLMKISGFILDISERKNLEEHIRQAQRMESVGLLAGGIAHDFKNLLGIIQGHVSLMPKAYPESDAIAKRIGAINTAVERGSRLVQQLLTFARTTDVPLESIDINAEVTEFVRMLSGTLPDVIEIKTELDERVPPSPADRNKIHQVLLNLSLNARDAILEGPGAGSITIRTDMRSAQQVRTLFPEAQAGEYVCVSVADTGKGMEEKTKQRVFEPFFTTKPQGKGTGLGLSVVQGVARTLQGYVQVESDLGKGATFSLYIPAVVLHQEASSGQTADSVADQLRGNETVLVVEDEEMLRELLSSTLENHGYRVLAAQNGQEAMDIFKSSQDEIAVVFTDIGLPKQNGLEIFLKMKSSRPGINVIFTSGFLEPDTCASLIRAGAKMVIEKPFQGDQVVRAIRQVIDSSKKEPAVLEM